MLAHPEQGVLCLEVKGGGIECRHGEWFRSRRAAEPSESATRSTRPSTTASPWSGCSRSSGWNGREPLLGHAVLFPYKHVFFSSIRAFKGLESPVVILCELEDIDDMTQKQQLYVAISRARNHCVVVLPPAG